SSKRSVQIATCSIFILALFVSICDSIIAGIGIKSNEDDLNEKESKSLQPCSCFMVGVVFA
ncbi:hypothetical protein OFP26_38450, partial [Escherichia coli]|nr:hypothetical protein [Escherichia coli]